MASLLSAPAFLRGIRSDAAETTSELFSLGVASGDPSSQTVVLWTRLAPEPLSGGGMPQRPVRVRWKVATDPGMSRVVRSGSSTAHPQRGHNVQVVVSGLRPDRWYYYRFTAMGESSRVGRTRTFPRPHDRTKHLRFAFASCQNYAQGFFPAFRHMAEQELDFVVHTGDYIYEGGPSPTGLLVGRNHDSEEIYSVEDYRNRYALYRLDPDLQAVHAQFPFLVTWDDHEVENNYAGLIPEESSETQGAAFVQRRLNAYQVYGESMPLRWRNRIVNRKGRLRLYRKFSFGQLADFFMLDTRQFRTDQPAEDNFGSTDPDSQGFVEQVLGEKLFDANGIRNSEAQMLGKGQQKWLTRCLFGSCAKWNFMAQQTMMTRWNLIETTKAKVSLDPSIPAEDKPAILDALGQVKNILNVDAWDGYESSRSDLFDLLFHLRPANPVVLTGDIHSAWGANLLNDFADPASQMLAAEFVCSSISSTFLSPNPRPVDAIVRAGLPMNPHIEFFNGLFRGYSICDVTPKRCQTEYYGVGTLEQLAATGFDALDPTLIPRPESKVELDSILEIKSGFNEDQSDHRIETLFSRI